MPGGAWVTLRLHLPLAADAEGPCQFWGDRSKCAWTGLGLDALRGGGQRFHQFYCFVPLGTVPPIYPERSLWWWVVPD